MKPLQRPSELKAYYQDAGVARDYLARRTTQPLGGAMHAEQVRFLNRAIAERAPRTVLEVAPGPARLSAEIRAVPRGIAAEFSPAMLEVARARTLASGRPWHFVRADAFHLPLAEGSVDLAFTLRFVRHFDAANRSKLYAEFQRVLRRGGALIVDAQNRAVRDANHVGRHAIFDQLYTAAELKTELHANGFRVLRMSGVIKHHAVQRRLNRLRAVGLGAIARGLIDVMEWLPSRNPSTWMLLCERE